MVQSESLVVGTAWTFTHVFIFISNSLQANMVDKYKTNVKGKIKRFSDYLGQKSWFTGEQVSECIGQ